MKARERYLNDNQMASMKRVGANRENMYKLIPCSSTPSTKSF